MGVWFRRSPSPSLLFSPLLFTNSFFLFDEWRGPPILSALAPISLVAGGVWLRCVLSAHQSHCVVLRVLPSLPSLSTSPPLSLLLPFLPSRHPPLPSFPPFHPSLPPSPFPSPWTAINNVILNLKSTRFANLFPCLVLWVCDGRIYFDNRLLPICQFIAIYVYLFYYIFKYHKLSMSVYSYSYNKF